MYVCRVCTYTRLKKTCLPTCIFSVTPSLSLEYMIRPYYCDLHGMTVCMYVRMYGVYMDICIRYLRYLR